MIVKLDQLASLGTGAGLGMKRNATANAAESRHNTAATVNAAA